MAATDIGHNYASALIDALRSPEEIERAGADLAAFRAIADQLPGLVKVLEHPGLPIERRRRILDEVLSRIDPMPASRRFLHLVVEKGRVRFLPAIVTSFEELRDAKTGAASADVVTATPLDGRSRARWEKALARLTGRKVNVTFHTDASLIGGALTRVGSVVYDGSVRKQLSRIRGVLLESRT